MSKILDKPIINLQVIVASVTVVLLFSKQWEKLAFRVLVKHCFLITQNSVQIERWR